MATMAIERTARKPHSCDRCRREIRPGERYVRWSCTPWDMEINQGPHWLTVALHPGETCPDGGRRG